MSIKTVEKLDLKGMSRSKIEATLSDIASEMVFEHWGIALRYPIEVRVNGRLTRSLGRMNYTNKNSKRIEMGKRLIDYGASEVILDVLLHEVTHWILLHTDKPFSDGHPYFEAELVRVGAKGTGKFIVGLHHVYNCDCDGAEHETRTKADRYQCASCKVPLKFSHSKTMDGIGNTEIIKEEK